MHLQNNSHLILLQGQINWFDYGQIQAHHWEQQTWAVLFSNYDQNELSSVVFILFSLNVKLTKSIEVY